MPVRRVPSAAVRQRRTTVIVSTVLVSVVVALAILFGVGSLAGAEQDERSVTEQLSPTPVGATFHIVESGDTLWMLARRFQPNGDIRPLVARMRTEHGPGPLIPGQRLRLDV